MEKMSWCSSLIVSLSIERAIYIGTRVERPRQWTVYIVCYCLSYHSKLRLAALAAHQAAACMLHTELVLWAAWLHHRLAPGTVFSRGYSHCHVWTTVLFKAASGCFIPSLDRLMWLLEPIDVAPLPTWHTLHAEIIYTSPLIKKSKQSISIDRCHSTIYAISKDPGLSTSKIQGWVTNSWKLIRAHTGAIGVKGVTYGALWELKG